MKKTVFECDVCHCQRQVITRIKVEATRLFLANGNGEKPLTSFQPACLEADVCSESCAMTKVSILMRDHFAHALETAPCSEVLLSDPKP